MILFILKGHCAMQMGIPRQVIAAIGLVVVLILNAPLVQAADITLQARNDVRNECMFQRYKPWSLNTLDFYGKDRWSYFGSEWMGRDCEAGEAAVYSGDEQSLAIQRKYTSPTEYFWSGDQATGERILAINVERSLRLTHDDAAFYSVSFGRVIEISGMIKKGDADRLAQFVQSRGLLNCLEARYCPVNNVISLNSPGGNLSEALKIAKYIQENQFITLLDKDATCESACSFIFFAGFSEYEGYFHSRRFAHDTAKLGVHRPAVTLPKDTFSSDRVEQIIKLVDDVKAEAVRQFIAAKVDLSILEQMYATLSSDMYHLSVPELQLIATVFESPPSRAKFLNRPGVLALCSGLYQQEYGTTNAQILETLDVRSDSFVAYDPHGEFVCYGAKTSLGEWVYDSCGETRNIGDCAMHFLGCRPSAWAKEFWSIYEPSGANCSKEENEHTDVFAENVARGNLGEALDFIRGADRQKAARNAISGGTGWMLPNWVDAAVTPTAFCGAIDFRDPRVARPLQSLLARGGFDPGGIDGMLGAGSFQAIARANRALLKSQSDLPSRDLLIALGMTAQQADTLVLCQ